jgi:hypothetical protein
LLGRPGRWQWHFHTSEQPGQPKTTPANVARTHPDATWDISSTPVHAVQGSRGVLVGMPSGLAAVRRRRSRAATAMAVHQYEGSSDRDGAHVAPPVRAGQASHCGLAFPRSISSLLAGLAESGMYLGLGSTFSSRLSVRRKKRLGLAGKGSPRNQGVGSFPLSRLEQRPEFI